MSIDDISGIYRENNADISLIFIADILKALTGRYLQAYLVLLLRYIKIYRGPVLTMENPGINEPGQVTSNVVHMLYS